MFITNELFDERKKLLCEAFDETYAHPELIDKWLALDESFICLIVKESVSQCVPRFKTDSILNFSDSRK